MQIITISSKNQITLPVKKLKELGFGKKAVLETEGDSIKITPVGNSVVDEVAGSMRKYISKDKLGASLKTIYEETAKIVARELASK